MQKLFISLVAFLAIWSAGVYLLLPENTSDKPVIYWVTDSNPARILQVERFHQWMEKNNYPEVELRLDTSNSDVSKKIIQSVSGVASDIMDLSSDQVDFFVRMGVLNPITEDAKEMGFAPDATYPAIYDIVVMEGDQYTFPCNVSVASLIVNRQLFEDVDMSPPPENWTIEEFEAIGKEYVKRSNEGLERQTRFFSSAITRLPITRSMGSDYFNETLTRSTLDSEAYIQTLKYMHKWIYEDKILPSTADLSSMSTDSGYGGQALQLLNNGNYAMVQSGRYSIIQLREFGEMDLDVSAMPNGGFPNSVISTRSAGIYEGSKHPELARYFLKFLASPEYSELIVFDGDALPPSPAMTQTEEFLRPEKYPNEHDFHEPFPRFAGDIAIPPSTSPYVVGQTVRRVETEAYDTMMANLGISAEEIAKNAAQRINGDIQRTLNEQPALKKEYEQRLEIQKKIDALKAAGKPIPAEYIYNPFHKAYYKKLGLLETKPSA